MADAEKVERTVLSIMDEGRALANALVPGRDLGLSRGAGALHLAFAALAQDAIEDVYADCGDTDAGVLASNVGQRIAHEVYEVLFGERTSTDVHPAHTGHEYGGAYARGAALAAGDPDWMNATGGPKPDDAGRRDD